MYKMFITNFPKSSQQNHNYIESTGRYSKKNNLESHSESSSYCYCKKNTRAMYARKIDKETAEKWREWQNYLIFKFSFKIQEEEKILPTHRIKRNENLKSILNRGCSL